MIFSYLHHFYRNFALIIAITCFVSSSLSSQLAHSKNSKTEKRKVIASAITDKFSINFFAMSAKDLIPVNKEKEAFTFDDKKIIWSAAIRGGVGKYNKKDYQVYWYSPDGKLYEKQMPKYIVMDCSGLKCESGISETEMKDKVGIWKLEVVYGNQIIDEKYFYVGDGKKAKVTQEEKDYLDSILFREKRVGKTKEEAAQISRDVLVNKILSEEINAEKAKDLVSIILKTSPKTCPPIVEEEGNTYVSLDIERLSFCYKFKAFFGTLNRDLLFYLVSPRGELVQENKLHFIINDEATFGVKKENIRKMVAGSWKAILCLKDDKINEENFILTDNNEFSEKYEKYKKKMDEEAKKMEKKAKVHPAQRSGKPVAVWQIKKGSTRSEIQKKWGNPDKTIEVSEKSHLWVYWTPGANDAHSGSRVAGIASQGNIIGALIYSAISHTVDSMFAFGKIIIVYFENEIVKGVKYKDCVSYADLKDLDLKRLKYVLKSLSIDFPVTSHGGGYAG